MPKVKSGQALNGKDMARRKAARSPSPPYASGADDGGAEHADPEAVAVPDVSPPEVQNEPQEKVLSEPEDIPGRSASPTLSVTSGTVGYLRECGQEIERPNINW